MPVPTPLDDRQRLKTLRETLLIDSPAEEAFDRLTTLATRILEAPISLVSLVDADRQFFKSCVGLPEPWASERETPLSHSFCQHTVTTGEPLIIEDARQHPLVRDSLAIPDLDVIAYAGIPLELDGQPLGSFCVIDAQPRVWTDDQIEILHMLARSAMAEIRLRITTRELELAARQREEVLSVVSHDLRNPLSLVLSGTSILRTIDLPEERRTEQLDLIHRAAQRMLRLTDDLLELNRIEAQSLELRMDPVPVDRLLREAVGTARPAAEEKRIALDFSAPDDAAIAGDEDRLLQALGNLLSNAIRVTPERGRVRVVADTPPAENSDGEPRVRIEVADTGPGVPEADRARIFDRFYQGEGQTRGSAGLGLAIVKAIAHAHGGDVGVGGAPGGGARFYMDLPRA